MLFSGFQTIKQWSVLGLLFVLSSGLIGCQVLATGVDAILKQEDGSSLTVPQKNAFSAFEGGRYSQAVVLFEAAIERDPNSELKAKLYNGLGLAYNELNRRSEAIAAYQDALKLNPANAQVWVNIGIVQRLDGDYDEALKSYEMALELDAQLATAHSSIGSLWVLQGEPELAIASFQNAIALDGTISVSHGNLALAQAMVGQFEKAQISLARAVELGYDNGDLIQDQINRLKSQP